MVSWVSHRGCEQRVVNLSHLRTRLVIIETFFSQRCHMNLNFQAEYFEPPAPCKSAFMELPSTPGPHSYSSYNPVPPNYNPYTAAMRYYHHSPSSQDYSLACNARNSFPMPPVLNHHPLSHHPYLTPSMQGYGPPHDSPHDGKSTFKSLHFSFCGFSSCNFTLPSPRKIRKLFSARNSLVVA